MNAYLYVFDTLSDWEIGYITAELNTGRFFKQSTNPLRVITIANKKDTVKTMGGIRILPDQTVAETVFTDNDLLLLPGGETWLEDIHLPILSVVTEYLPKGLIVGAICGATMALAKTGILDTRKHTSNDLNFLQQVCPDYIGSELYVNEPAVTDGNLITAPGTAPLEFAQHILKRLDVFKPESLDAWCALHKFKDSSYFYALLASLQ
ncbi:MAG: glutamine amidotransferase [Bacteroidetes bacterium]|nr:glutamine amidotransferase [Bacteroidota bacterium]